MAALNCSGAILGSLPIRWSNLTCNRHVICHLHPCGSLYARKTKASFVLKATASTNGSHFYVRSPITEFWNANVIIDYLVNVMQIGADTVTYLLDLKWSSSKWFICISKPLHIESVKYGIVVYALCKRIGLVLLIVNGMIVSLAHMYCKQIPSDFGEVQLCPVCVFLLGLREILQFLLVVVRGVFCCMLKFRRCNFDKWYCVWNAEWAHQRHQWGHDHLAHLSTKLQIYY